MNFDWTPEENDIRARMWALLNSSACLDPASLHEADAVRLKAAVGSFLRDLADIGYLSVAVGPQACSETMKLLAGRTELARRDGSLFLAVET